MFPVTFCIWMVLVVPILTTPVIENRSRDEGDTVYFPEQVEYLKSWMKVCPDKVFWPVTGRCWPSGSRGPCDLGRVLVYDRERITAKCVPESEASKYPFQTAIIP